ncbi:unnamed protein product, partial [marine sediment metagenome]
MSVKEKYVKAARIIIKAGILPFPLTDTLLEILYMLLEEDDLDFIMAFKRKFSQTIEQLKKSSKLPEEEILKMIEKLASKGVVFNQPNSQGVMVIRLLPLMMVGPFEYIFMRKVNHTEEEKKLAKLFKTLFNEAKDLIHEKYDMFLPVFQKLPPIDRTVPILQKTKSGQEVQISVNETVEVPEEKILITQDIKELINKFDDIAVGFCFCRQHEDLLGNPYKETDLRENCQGRIPA